MRECVRHALTGARFYVTFVPEVARDCARDLWRWMRAA